MTDKTLRCPTCNQPFFAKFSEAVPFCSLRCRQIDLGRWLTESYALPVEGDEEREFEEPSELDLSALQFDPDDED